MQLLLCSIGKWFLRKIEEVKLKVSQNLSEPLHKSRASSDGSDAHFAQSGEEKKQIYNWLNDNDMLENESGTVSFLLFNNNNYQKTKNIKHRLLT